MSLAYGIGGLVSVPPPAISQPNPPPASFVGKLGQQFFDTSVTPPAEYVYNGQTWVSGGNAYATTTTAGIVELATTAEMNAGTSTTLVPPVKEVFDYVNSVALAGAPVATEVTAGIGQLATDAEAVAGTPSTPLLALFVTPSNLAPVFAAPPAIGGTTAAAGTFTDLTADGTGAVSLGSNAAADFTVATGDLSLIATLNSININAGEAADDAVRLVSAAGGLDADFAKSIFLTTTEANADSFTMQSSGGMVATVTGAAGKDISFTCTSGSINLTAGESAVDSVKITSSIGGIQILAAGAAAGEDIQIASTGSSVVISATEAVADAINIDATAGGIDVDAVGQVNIASSQDAADAIVLSSSAGGISIAATGEAGQDIDITNTGGSVNVTATENAALAVHILANGGVSETVRIRSAQGTGAASIDILSTAGGVTVAGGLGTADAVNITASTAGGGIDIDSSTGGFDVLTTGAISLDASLASNLTVTGAAADLTLSSSGGSVNITATEAANDAIVMNASDAAGGVQIQAGTGGILIGDQADCTTIDVGNFAPTASRTITVGGGTVVTAAVTDTVSIGPDGATTNADSVKTVNVNTGGVTTGQVLTNIATGAVTSGTHTTKIATGNRAAGTMSAEIMTGTGTKTLSIGNADGLTTTSILGPVNINVNQNNNVAINSGTSTGTITIGNTAAGAVILNSASTIAIGDASAGAVSIDTAAGISLDGATASNFTVTGAAQDLTLSSSGGSVNITATEAAEDAIVLNASNAAGGINLTTGGGSVDISSAGFATVVAATDTQASPSATATINANVGRATFTGFTTAAAASQVFVITNSIITTSSCVIVTVCNEGANDAQMTIQRVTRAAGSMSVTVKNNGAAALNGNVAVNFWVLTA